MAPYKATIVVLDTKNDQDVMLAEVFPAVLAPKCHNGNPQ